MVQSILKKHWLRLPRWGALALGFGALFAGGAQAGNPDRQALGNVPPQPNAHGSAADQVTIRLDSGKVYVSQGGSASEALTLRDTPEAAYFRTLLDEAGVATGSVSVPVDSTIVASGGGGVSGRKPKKPTPGTEGSGPAQPTTSGPGTR